MVRALHEQPTVGDMFVSHLLNRNSKTEEDMVDQLINSSEKRLAPMLLLLAKFGKESGLHPIAAKISQETLTGIGTRWPRVSRFTNKFRKLGFIDYNGHLRVHSSLLGAVLRDRAWESTHRLVLRHVQ